MNNAKYLQVDVNNVIIRIRNLMSDYPELSEDMELLEDTLEGETDAKYVLTRIVDEKLHADDMMHVLKIRAEAIKVRMARFSDKSDAMSELALTLLQVANLSKMELEEATVSIRKPLRKVEIVDEAEIPSQLMRVKSEPDKAAIKKALEQQELVPGARLIDGEFGVTIRRT
jgi:Siphovirus Gp157